jgi:LysM repeat protein
MVLGVLVSVPFAALLVVLGSVSADAGTAGAASGPATGIVVVQAGESLWQIAQEIAPQSDPRATITAIRELNGLGEQAVVPGQSIIVPTSG